MTPDQEGFEPGKRTYPYWDENVQSMVYGHHGEEGEWMVSVTPMIFNDRVLLTHRDGYPLSWVAGFCYDKGSAAGLAAMAWDPTVDKEPLGHKKVAGDSRNKSGLPSFTCPKCGAVSYHPKDLEHGYCGRCHAFTEPR